ncbi:glutamate-1-semialdehyde 2,1-aminomutase [Lentisphaerota bacterium ZTH]|nr:glutamate-1-semialdehyde 2,1-aminomutase [Lentisphaerota bacterium]WET07553.1 glutamate-1-semialdehyde 2,1-aminomutase [Lentisphaerota bacterium ZTH]
MKLSHELFSRAKKIIPGGVNSPVRAFSSVKGDPIYITGGKGSKITDVDGNKYIDFCGSWGPLVLGHADPEVVQAVCKTAARGLTFGACCPLEVEFAELFCDLVPHVDMVRMVNSGTEAVMTAIRLARGFTGKNLIIKFDGCYHGHSDQLLVSAGSGLLTNSIASSKGVTDATISEVLTLPYNDIEKVTRVFKKYKNKIAAVIVEPVAGNMGLVPGDREFLASLRSLTRESGSCLIFDEVITGFRFHAGAYSQLIGINPDISTFGKIIGGGMPVGAVAAGREIMQQLAPLGDVYQAGTLSGNPIAAAAGIATLNTLRNSNPYPHMEWLATVFAEKVNAYAEEDNLPVHCRSYGGVFTVFFTARKPLHNMDDVKTCDTGKFAAFHAYMLERGYYFSPSQFELNFVSMAHTESEVAAAAEAVLEFFDIVRSE